MDVGRGKSSALFLAVAVQVGACARTPIAEQPHPAAGGPGLRLLSYDVNYDFNEEEDGRAVKFLVERAMLSALGRFAPREPTWRWSTVVGVLAAEVREAGRSDHLPVIAVVASAKRSPRMRGER